MRKLAKEQTTAETATQQMLLMLVGQLPQASHAQEHRSTHRRNWEIHFHPLLDWGHKIPLFQEQHGI